MSKLKITGFARFFLFLIIVIPSIYFGVTYYKGENGLDNIKEFLGMEKSNDTKQETADFPSTNSNDVIELKAALRKAEAQNAALRKELASVKEQLDQIKALTQ